MNHTLQRHYGNHWEVNLLRCTSVQNVNMSTGSLVKSEKTTIINMLQIQNGNISQEKQLRTQDQRLIKQDTGKGLTHIILIITDIHLE